MTPAGINLKISDLSIKNNAIYINTNLTGKNPGLILIWADYCGHCHRFLPTFNKLSQQLGNEFPFTSIEHSELKKDQDIMQTLDFKGYPTIKFFDQNGKIIGEYNSGDRSTDAILSHICEIYHHCIKFH